MNQQTRLVLVEGVPFTGKSTTSEYIATQLKLNGYPVHWVSEGMLFQHHFPYVIDVGDRKQPFSEAVLRAEWSTFVETVQASTTMFVVDSALSYAAIDPFLNEDWPVEAIYAAVRQIADLCAPLYPHVIHLTGDVEHLVPASIAERGAGWQEQLIQQAEATPYQQARGRFGVAGATQLMYDSQVLVGAILARTGWPTLTLDVTGADRPTHRRAILAFLGLNEVAVDQPTLARSVLESYVGTYTTDDPDRRDKVLSVQLEHETLTLHGPSFRYGPLVPISATRFHLQASPVDIEFVVQDGLVQELTLHRSDGKLYSYRRG